MSKVVSRDGTPIAYDRIGAGAPVILIDGALCYRAFGPLPKVAALLADRFTVFTYDRRGRGESGDTRPYAVEREVEDLEALVREAGGSACVLGVSSGAALALEAAARIPGIQRLALYEAPFIVDDTLPARPDDYLRKLDAMIAADRRADALKVFMKTVGMPSFAIAMMQLMPSWKKLKNVAHTLPNDFRILGDTGSGRPLPADRWRAVTAPALVGVGGKSPVWMKNGMRALADVLPNARHDTLAGQTHMVKAEVLAPWLASFFAAERG